MADKKISALPLASTPLLGSEVLPIVQNNTTVKTSIASLTADIVVAVTIDHTSGGILTVDANSGYNIFNVILNSNVTAINVTGTPKFGQKLAFAFLQTGAYAVTTAQANWTTNSVANFQFPGLVVPSLPGSNVSGRWGYIEFIYADNTLLPEKWVMVSSQINCG